MKKILEPRDRKKSNSAPDGEGDRREKVPMKYTPRGGGEKNRILVATKDGLVDFNAMAPEAAKEFNDMMHTPEVQAQFNIGPLSAKFNPEHCKRFYEALGHLLQTVGQVGFHLPPEALKALEYTEDEKDELAKPTASALDELAPSWLRDNQAVAAFFLLFGTITQGKIRTAMIVAQQVKFKNAQPANDKTNANANEMRGPVRIPIPTPPAGTVTAQ
jgi:hypothetical protein